MWQALHQPMRCYRHAVQSNFGLDRHRRVSQSEHKMVGSMSRPGPKQIKFTGLIFCIAMGGSPVYAAGDGIWKSGADVYSKICTYCHDAGVGPVLKGRKLPPEMITKIVRQGLIEMPAFPESFIDNKTLQDLAKYIQKSDAPQTQPPESQKTK